MLATLENEQRQTTIKQVASKTETAVRLDDHLAELPFEFDTKLLAHRRELVAVMHFLQQRHVLALIDRDDLGYVQSQSDCLYRIGRSALSSMLCSVRGASTIPQADVNELILQLNETEVPETPQAQNEESALPNDSRGAVDGDHGLVWPCRSPANTSSLDRNVGGAVRRLAGRQRSNRSLAADS